MAQTEDILRNFETKLRMLIARCNSLKEENKALRTTLEEKELVIDSLERECMQAKSNYDNLKLAKMIEISDADMEGARSRLSKLVREVDKCISLLKV